MTYTYDPTNDIGRVRRTLPDKEEADAIWTDEEIQSFLNDEGSDWRRATALALETMASDDLLVLKVVRIQNIETNTDRLAKALFDRAKKLRELAAEADSSAGDSFDFATPIVSDHQYNEHVWNSARRGSI